MQIDNELLQRDSFNSLVEEGVYSHGFSHPDKALRHVDSALSALSFEETSNESTFNVLDSGCGTGYWSEYLARHFGDRKLGIRLMAFDLADGMVELAREKLAGIVASSDIRVGNMLEASAYRFPNCDGMDLIFVYDAIQQLPRQRQYEAIQLIADSLADGGTALVFDHDKDSSYGKKMEFQKFVTRYLRIPLVPRYYCNAKYPPLGKIALKLNRLENIRAEVDCIAGLTKCVLRIRKEQS